MHALDLQVRKLLKEKELHRRQLCAQTKKTDAGFKGAIVLIQEGSSEV